MSNRLENKTALVTGGATGLGFAIAKRFIQQGARVVISDIDVATGKAAATEIGARFEEQNVVNETRWAELLQTLGEDGWELTTLVNNAGIEIDGGVLIEDIDITKTKLTMDVNLVGTLLGCKYAIRQMKENGGSIINLSSIGGLIPSPVATAYGASKAAVRHLTTTVAMQCAQLGYDIRCNSLHPGLIQTRMLKDLMESMAAEHGVTFEEARGQFLSMVPTNKIGTPEDVANAALYLASDESQYVTGDQMMIDGGMLLTS